MPSPQFFHQKVRFFKIPKVTVIIPVFNTEKYLKQCLESVLCQSLKEIQVIVIDDASPDACSSIIEEYARRDGRVQHLTHSENRGVSATRNTGLDAAKAEFVFFLDSDDLIPPESLKNLYETAVSDSAEIVRGHRPRLVEQEDGYIIEPAYFDGEFFSSIIRRTNIVHYPYIVRSSNSLSSMYKRDFLENYRLRFHLELPYREDRAFYMQTYLRAQMVTLIPKAVTYYRQRRSGKKSILKNRKPGDILYLIRQTEIVHDQFKALDLPFSENQLKRVLKMVKAISLRVLMVQVVPYLHELPRVDKQSCYEHILTLLHEVPSPKEASLVPGSGVTKGWVKHHQSKYNEILQTL